MKKHFISVLSVGVLSSALLVGCGSSTDASGNTGGSKTVKNEKITITPFDGGFKSHQELNYDTEVDYAYINNLGNPYPRDYIYQYENITCTEWPHVKDHMGYTCIDDATGDQINKTLYFPFDTEVYFYDRENEDNPYTYVIYHRSSGELEVIEQNN